MATEGPRFYILNIEDDVTLIQGVHVARISPRGFPAYIVVVETMSRTIFLPYPSWVRNKVLSGGNDKISRMREVIKEYNGFELMDASVLAFCIYLIGYGEPMSSLPGAVNVRDIRMG
jgi:hypothetical protein